MWNTLSKYWRWVAIMFIVTIGIMGLIESPSPLTIQARDLFRPMVYQSPIGNPQLAIDKQVSDPRPASGETIAYTLHYSNTQAGSQAFNVYIYDFLPEGMSYISASPHPDSVHDNTLIFSAASIGPATENTTITVQAKVMAENGSLRNHALIVADGVTPTTASALITVQAPQYKLTLSKNGPSAVLVGDTIDYTLYCRNTGTAPIDNVTVMDVLPSNVTFKSAAPPPDSTTPTLSWNIGRLEANEVWKAVLTTTAPTVIGRITNTVLAAGQQTTLTYAVLSTEVITQGAILDVEKTATPSSLQVGDTVTYTIHYRNSGNQAATDCVLTDTLPANLQVTKYDPTTTSQIGTQAIWTLGNIAPGATGTMTITAQVTGGAGTSLKNEVDITGSGNTYPAHDDVNISIESYDIYLPVIVRRF